MTDLIVNQCFYMLIFPKSFLLRLVDLVSFTLFMSYLGQNLRLNSVNRPFMPEVVLVDLMSFVHAWVCVDLVVLMYLTKHAD